VRSFLPYEEVELPSGERCHVKMILVNLDADVVRYVIGPGGILTEAFTNDTLAADCNDLVSIPNPPRQIQLRDLG